MGKSITPTFRIDYTETGTGRSTRSVAASEAWQTKYAGRPTEANLRKWVEGMNKSYRMGGVNHHLVQAADEMLEVGIALVIRQATGDVVAAFDKNIQPLRTIQKVKVSHG